MFQLRKSKPRRFRNASETFPWAISRRFSTVLHRSSLSLCFVLHFSYHESRCEFLSLLCIFSSLFCVFCFFADFHGLFLGQFPLFSSLPLLKSYAFLRLVSYLLFTVATASLFFACYVSLVLYFMFFASLLHLFFSPV